MTTNISEHEKEIIRQVDSQVKMLQKRNASDEAILDALVDFFADVKCIVENSETKEIQMLLAGYEGFSYFVSLISLTMTEF